jgi:hypothetical protein
MKFFVRYTKDVTSDLERGYSFDSYRIYDSPQECAEDYGLEEGDYEVADYGDNPGYYFDGLDCEWVIAPTSDSADAQWGMMLDGLCGYGPFDSAAEAEAFIANGGGDIDRPDWAHIFEGEESMRPLYDGVLFHPRAVVK